MGAARSGVHRPGDADDPVEPRPPQGWARKLLLIFPAALFLFLLGVLVWGILADLLSGY